MRRLPFPLQDQLPLELKGILFDFWWDADKLHLLDLPKITVLTDELLWHLDLPWWQYQNKPFQVTPRQVLENPAMYQEQYERTLAADLAYPITVRKVGERLIILDGIHRLLKAAMQNISELEANVFSDQHIPLILHRE